MRLHFSIVGTLLCAAACSGTTTAASGPFVTLSAGKADGRGVVGPGDDATDQRVPELGGDPRIVRASKISLGAGVRQVEAAFGRTIEAKFELDDAGALSLSIYPVGKSITLDAERNVFEEASGDPKTRPWTPGLEVFADAEHLTRSARDLTLVQTASLRLADAVALAEAQVPGGITYWAIPTMRHHRAGYGVYVLAPDNRSHYFFVC
jgi:hypothetical protein